MDKRLKMEKRNITDIQTELDRERSLINALYESCAKWEEMILELENSSGIHSEVEPGGTWKTRYAFQFLHNRNLRQQIKEMRAHLRLLQQGHIKFPTDIDWDKTTPAECRRHLKTMQIEITSLRGLHKSIEEKLDNESIGYRTAKDQCDAILNDVWFQQQSRIKHQESQEKEMFSQYRKSKEKTLNTGRSKIKLPPISPKPASRQDSYLSQFELIRSQKQHKKEMKKQRSVRFQLDNT